MTRWLGTGKVTAFSVATTAIALFGFSVTRSFWGLCLWAVPYGLGAGSVDASHEKHVPHVNVGDGVVEVNVGSVNHPMEEVHWIEWVQLVTDKGSYRKWLNPGEAPNVKFLLNEEKPLAVYAYCNLHGLWKKELN